MAVKLNKRMKKAYDGVDRAKAYSWDEAFDQLEQSPKVKFDETVELHVHLAIDASKNDQMIRGTVILPHGTGKKIRLAVFAKGEKAKDATSAGADHVGGEDLIEKVQKGFLDFDMVIATPDMMRDLSKLGKVLGPRGLMPTPKAGTVTQDIGKAIKDAQAGKIEFKTDKQAGVHVGIGKRSFERKQLVENAKFVIDAMNNAKPASVKGQLIKTVYVSSTMGSGVKVSV